MSFRWISKKYDVRVVGEWNYVEKVSNGWASARAAFVFSTISERILLYWRKLSFTRKITTLRKNTKDWRFDWFNGMVQCMPHYHVSLWPVQWVTASDGRPIDTHDGSLQEEPTASHLVVEMWSAAARTSYLSRQRSPLPDQCQYEILNVHILSVYIRLIQLLSSPCLTKTLW
jgi:hypothetical protein